MNNGQSTISNEQSTVNSWDCCVLPYRTCPESVRRIMVTQLVVLIMLSLLVVWLRGGVAFEILFVGMLSGLLVEKLAARLRYGADAGDIANGMMMGLLAALTLPCGCKWYVAVVAAVVAVAVGKYLSGGMGHYVWHPALVGWLIAELFFLNRNQGGVGDEAVLGALRVFDGLNISGSRVDLGRYIADNLPALKGLMVNTDSSLLGQSCAIMVVVVGLYFMYRGYVHWHLPCFFVVSAYVAAAICPLIVHVPVQTQGVNVVDIATTGQVAGMMRGYAVWFPISAGGWAAGFTYLNYQIFAGGLLFGAFILSADMTSRPVKRSGQVIFAVGAGILTIILRLYSPLAIPCFAAILIMSTLRGVIDRVTGGGGMGRF